MQGGRALNSRLIILLIAVSLMFIGVGCGGGGGGGGSSETTESTVSGIAAAGAPIVGTVNIRGADGVTSYSAIEADGSYTVDVSAMTPPFVIWADGSANGRSVTLYSTIDEPGTVNVTPATDVIVATALGQDPEDYYDDNPDAGPPSSDAMEDAQNLITDLLSSVFASLDMPQDFDLMNGSFTVGEEGFDQVLDAVSMTSDDTTVSLTDNASGEVLFSDDSTTDGIDEELSPDEIDDIVGPTIDRIDQITESFNTILALYETSEPSLDTLMTVARPLMTDDFLDDGSNADDMLERWLMDDDEGPIVGMSLVSVAPYREMKSHTLLGQTIDEKGDYANGLWCYITVRWGDNIETFPTSFVQSTEGAEWKWYGDRNPFLDGGDVDAEAVQIIQGDYTTYYSGLDVWIEDTGNVAYTSGIVAVAIINNSFPLIATDTDDSIRGLVLARMDDVSPEYKITNVETAYHSNFYSETDGLDIAGMTDMEFLFVGIDEAGTPKLVWIDVLSRKPLHETDLESDMFPVLISPTTLAELDIPGTVTVSWQNPSNEYTDFVDWVDLSWWNYNGDTRMDSDNPAWLDSSLDLADWTSTAFDTSATTITQPTGACIGIQTQSETDDFEFETIYYLY
ncbi:hypothetical protein DSCO28_41830 [Desulfosarcina ovata subsp. sediminis]|uniref:Uncharacterized protein n=2 Tax=Desulfosarcina ovata TaxID=83564 RepID=A0A5K7ZTS5_9BACT|nr:hypothetical protein DSCO28_41830 [Desulfosarcina ovata subsp. sediminis]